MASEPEALLAVLKDRAYHFKRIGLEAGPHGGHIAIPVGVILFCFGALGGFEGLQFGETKEQAAAALGMSHLL